MVPAQVYSSMQQAVPGPFSGSGDHPLPGCPTFGKYDKQDAGQCGIRNILTRGVDHRISSLNAVMQRELRAHPEALLLFSTLINNASLHWRAFAQMLSEQRNICFQQCGDEKESWLFPSEIGRGVFNESYKVRNVGAERANVKTFSVEDAGRLLWGELRTHQLMEEFLYHKFMGHPKLAAYSIQHLFRNRLLPLRS